MCRSIIIKGLEAITVESMFTARRYGAEKQVLESLAATFPSLGWDGALPDYLISRVAEHGKRRAAEMREAAQAVAESGLEPLTALATAQRQDWLVQAIAEFSLAVPKGEKFAWQELADAIAEATSPGREIVRRNQVVAPTFRLAIFVWHNQGSLPRRRTAGRHKYTRV